VKRAPIAEVRINAVNVNLYGTVYRWSFRPEPYDPTVGRISTLTIDGGEDARWFVFYVEDCHSPALHLYRADSWERAYECFISDEADRGHYLINDDDPDYSEDDGTWTDDGRRVDSESFMGDAVDVVSIEVES